MYTGFLHLHRLVFYVLMLLLLVSVIKFLIGWMNGQQFSKLDNKLSLFTLIATHTQFLIGFVLYFISPVVQTGLGDVGAAMKDANLRFWTIEHILVMIIGVVLITMARSIGKKAKTDKQKHKKHVLFLIPGIILILSRVPWERIL